MIIMPKKGFMAWLALEFFARVRIQIFFVYNKLDSSVLCYQLYEMWEKNNDGLHHCSQILDRKRKSKIIYVDIKDVRLI